MATIYVENVYARLFGDLTSIVKAESVCTYTLKTGKSRSLSAKRTTESGTPFLLRSPTGSGKGEIVAGVIAAAREGRWLILTPRTSLVNDLKKRTHMKAGVNPVALGIPFSRPGVRIATYAGAAKMVKAAPQVFKD